MGFITDLLGLGRNVERIAEVFVPNKTQKQAQDHAQRLGAQAQFSAEFKHVKAGAFDRLVDGLNRLPRPVMALGTVGLFVFAMTDPDGFTIRMQGLAFVPDPLWWLLGAIVSFYFGAREMHHFRIRKNPTVFPKTVAAPSKLVQAQPFSENAALRDWAQQQEK